MQIMLQDTAVIEALAAVLCMFFTTIGHVGGTNIFKAVMGTLSTRIKSCFSKVVTTHSAKESFVTRAQAITAAAALAGLILAVRAALAGFVLAVRAAALTALTRLVLAIRAALAGLVFAVAALTRLVFASATLAAFLAGVVIIVISMTLFARVVIVIVSTALLARVIIVVVTMALFARVIIIISVALLAGRVTRV